MSNDKANHEIVQEQLSPCNTKIWLNSVAGCVARFNKTGYELATMGEEGVVSKFDEKGVSYAEFCKLVKHHFGYVILAEVI